MASSSWLPSRRSSTLPTGPELSSPTHTTTTSSLSSTSSSTITSSLPSQSSARPTREYGPVVGVAISGSVQTARDLNLNVTINNSQIDQHHPNSGRNSRGSAPAPSTPSRSSQITTPPPTPTASMPRYASSSSSGDSTLVDNPPITRNDIQLLLNRIESLETQLLQANNRSTSRSSRSSDVSSRPVPYPPTSPALSIISDISIPQPLNPTLFFLSSTQPPPAFPAGPLSISVDSSTSTAIMTPSSSGTSSDSSTSPVIITPGASGTSTPVPHSPPPSSRPSLPVTSTWSIRTRQGEASIRPNANSSCHMCRQPLTNGATAHCRSGCSQTYCVLCIGEWISSQLDDNREPSCPLCQVPWVF
ncbi:hypothetical protein DL98DRAFT_649777 [Cadophora sp. DSE1049]|nr:hypothetical protein DL98DRAFT_649777 [Cadophora sp. DSE1049]